MPRPEAPKPPYVANFDSASAMLQALARYLDGRDFPMLGVMPGWMAPIMKAVGATVNALPRKAQELVYIASGAMEALYAWHNAQRGIAARRLVVDSFIVMEPYWTVRAGAIPFWMVFNMQPSADALARYLDDEPRFDALALMLFSHGVDSVGLAPIERWREIAARARDGAFAGVDQHAYPRDFAVFVRYHYALRRLLRERHPMPPPLALQDVDAFMREQAPRHDVAWH